MSSDTNWMDFAMYVNRGLKRTFLSDGHIDIPPCGVYIDCAKCEVSNARPDRRYVPYLQSAFAATETLLAESACFQS